ncbi:MAG: hypothetical protein QXN26_02105 [Thermoplasmataceae archaeon]
MPDCIIIGGGPSGSVVSRILQKRGISTAIIDMRMEIGAPMTCDDLINISDIRNAGANPEEMRIEKLESVEIRCGSASLTLEASGKEGDAFNAALETDRLKKELTALAALEGSDVSIRSRAENFSFNSNNEFEVTVRTGSRRELLKSGFLVLAGGSWGNAPAFAGGQSGPGLIRSNFSYHRSASPPGVMRKATVSFSGIDHGISIENPVPGGFHDSLLMMYGMSENPSAGIPALPGCVASGERILDLPVSPVPEYGGAIVVGLQSGLWNPIFPSAFRQSIATARLAAECITGEFDGKIENAVQTYTERFHAELLPTVRDEFLLYRELLKSQPDGIEKFLLRLSREKFSEISLAEIERQMHMDIGRLIDILNGDY